MVAGWRGGVLAGDRGYSQATRLRAVQRRDRPADLAHSRPRVRRRPAGELGPGKRHRQHHEQHAAALSSMPRHIAYRDCARRHRRLHRRRRSGRRDTPGHPQPPPWVAVSALVTAVLVGWPAAVLVETRDVPFQSRYLFSMMMPLLVGCAVICGAVLRGRRLGGAWLAAGCASIAFALAVVVSTPPSSGAARPMTAAHSDQRRPPMRGAGGYRTQFRQPDRCPTGDGVDSAGGAHPPQPARLCHRPESPPSLRTAVARPAACTAPAPLDRQTNPVGNAGGNTGMRRYCQEVTSTSGTTRCDRPPGGLAWVALTFHG